MWHANDYPQECREPVGPTGSGRPGEVVANVTSPFLQQFLETDEFPVRFDVGGWVEIESISDGSRSWSKQMRPMMILFEPYPNGGRVAYTSFTTMFRRPRLCCRPSALWCLGSSAS